MIYCTFFWAIFVTAIGGAVVEEMVCRGLLMGYIEKKTNINIAIISRQSFWCHSFIKRWTNVTSFFLLLISGSLVGIMFGLATYKFNTIWASITLHFVGIYPNFYLSLKRKVSIVFGNMSYIRTT